ncbi:MAG: hypothetical protein AAF219_08105 [Myxococcota bacterium]
MIGLGALVSTILLGADGYALIVSNNRSLDLARPDLRYADDDGAQWAQLFSEVLGPDRVELLTRFDPESRLLHPEWTDGAEPPTLDTLERSVARLETRLDEGRAKNRPVDVYLVFAGHGDIAEGVGFIELEDARFDANALESLIARLSGAAHVHLVLDSCNSYFMLNPRSPRVERWEPPAKSHQSLLEKYPHVGAIISTSAEALTYEWSEIQSGVFSYQLRSALRGAADVDADGSVTYIEMEAFVETANRLVENELYRPNVYARAPADDDDAEFIDARQSNSVTLKLGLDSQRRLTFRDQRGVRLMDVHKERGTALLLRLPREQKIEITESIRGGERPELEVRTLPDGVQVTYRELASRSADGAERGSSFLFRALFGAPFGIEALNSFREASEQNDGPDFAVSIRETERLKLHLDNLLVSLDEQDVGGAAIIVGAVGLPTTIATFAAYSDGDSISRGTLALQAGVYVGGTAMITLLDFLIPNTGEKLLDSYEQAEFSTVEQRTKSVLSIEKAFYEAAEHERGVRRLAGGLSVVFGGLVSGYGTAIAIDVARDPAGSDRRYGGIVAAGSILFGLTYVGLGYYLRNKNLTPIERAWAVYSGDLSALGNPMASSPELSLSPWTTPEGGRGMSVGFGY